jgi:uncharacterized protein
MLRNFLTMFTVLLLTSSLAKAEAPAACTGRNLLEDLRVNDPAAAEAVLREAAAIPNSESLLWKIEAPGGQKPSWLFGTIHVTDSRVADPQQSIKDKIKDSRVLVLELKEAAYGNALTLKILERENLVFMPEQQTLWDLIPDDQEDRLRNDPLLAMIPAEFLARMQPWLVGASLATPMCEVIRKQNKFTLDQALAQRAQFANIPIEGLETIDEQLQVFSGTSLEDQVGLLLVQAASEVPTEDNFNTIVELYLSGHVSAVMPLNKRIHRSANDALSRAAENLEKNLIEKRNKVMAARAAAHIEEGGAFIAVGALHLAGDQGVVALLRRAGYKLIAAQ